MKYLSKSAHASPKIVDMLEANEIGQEGKGMVYKHLNVKPKIHHIAGAVDYLQLKLGGKPVGLCANVRRKLVNENTTGNYIRYFTFLRGFRVPNVNTDKKNKNSTIRKETYQYLNEQNGITYAYVDLTNERSKAICEAFDFKEAGQFTTLIFSRMFPKASSRLHETGLGQVEELLLNHYKDYSLFTLDNIRYKSTRYFVIKDGDEILAGLAATEEKWQIINMPDLLANMLLKIKLPFLGRLFNSNYRFLAIEGIYQKEKCEKELAELLESVLSITGHHVAMMWADVNSPLYHTLKSLPLGLLSKIKSEVRASVIVRKHDKRLKNIYVSGFDLT